LKLLYAKLGREPPAKAQALELGLTRKNLRACQQLAARDAARPCPLLLSTTPHRRPRLTSPPAPPCSLPLHDSHRRFILVLCVCARVLFACATYLPRLPSRLDLTRRASSAPTAPGCASCSSTAAHTYTPYHIQQSYLLFFAPTRLLQRARRVRAIRSARRRRRIPTFSPTSPTARV
jgi:hypothetical protein